MNSESDKAKQKVDFDLVREIFQPKPKKNKTDPSSQGLLGF